MKLSEKGLKCFINTCYDGDELYHYDALQHEFKPEDFTGAVVLTVEEAKAVLECVDACAFPSSFEGFVSENILLRDKLKKRIEQAEQAEGKK